MHVIEIIPWPRNDMAMCCHQRCSQVEYTDEDSESTPYNPKYDGKDKDMIIRDKDIELGKLRGEG